MSSSGRRRWLPLLSATALLATAACGSGSTGSPQAGAASSGCTLPATVRVAAIRDVTGPAAFAGLSANKGIELAVKQINSQGFLGQTKLEVRYSDPAGNAQTAASQVTSAIADRETAAIFGPVSGAQAIAASPLAERGRTPIIYTQAGASGVVTGEYTYRATPPAESYYPSSMSSYLREKGVKKLSVIYTSDFPTLKGIAEDILPKLGSQLGFEIVSSTGVPASTQDFTSPVQKALAAGPDTVAFLGIGPQNPTGTKQLRQAGFEGTLIGHSASGAGNLKPAGADAKGMTWPTDFHVDMPDASSQEFVRAYSAEYGEAPLNYAAEGYDSAWWLARGIKTAGCAERTAIQDGLDRVAAQGFEGALGKVSFEGRDVRLPGMVVQWDGTKEVLLRS